MPFAPPAITDHSGTVSLVENSGTITAAAGGQATAIDLSANTAGAIVRQLAAGVRQAGLAIVGDILLGTGNDTVAIFGGRVTGDIDFGGGADIFTLGGLSAATCSTARALRSSLALVGYSTSRPCAASTSLR